MTYFFSLWAAKFYWTYRNWLHAKRWRGYLVQIGVYGYFAGLGFSGEDFQTKYFGVFLFLLLLSAPISVLWWLTIGLMMKKFEQRQKEMERINKMYKYVPPKQD